MSFFFIVRIVGEKFGSSEQVDKIIHLMFSLVPIKSQSRSRSREGYAAPIYAALNKVL